ncbi:CubicO group peptidase (beta-lactamase class C family) [Paenibacillus sp. DS2015]|uniref:serine hydrolase domain-containing protein n=1 Tax=Paenibacillus sp. DS2015 TaxID=3373917 RepID=UPI003D1A18F1
MLKDRVDSVAKKNDFSGVVLMKEKSGATTEAAFGYSNRADHVLNDMNTRFGIASGCKLFTAIGICQLVDKGVLSFQAKLSECLDVDFPNFNSDITIHHLLTHSSGIPDYFDEEIMDDFEDLWKVKPMYSLRHLKDFLPMFADQAMMFEPGERFHYNNAGFIVLGLIIEQITGQSFSEYTENHIFKPLEMEHSGYFSLDHLPSNTAIGYLDGEDGSWRTNAYSIPVKGGADGGAYVTAPDMMKLWEGLFAYQLISPELTKVLLTPHIQEDDSEYYGYGVWITKEGDDIYKYHVMGYDPGINFNSSVYPATGRSLVITSNIGGGAYDITQEIEKLS